MKGVVGLKIDWLVKGAAKEALEEVLKDGDVEQQESAKIILEKL